jgi:hypothetical protein
MNSKVNKDCNKATILVSPTPRDNKVMLKERTRDALGTTSEHISTSTTRRPSGKQVNHQQQLQKQQLLVRRAASFASQHQIPGQRKRLVSFDADCISIVVGEVPSRSDLTEEDFKNIWYSKDDFKVMKKEYIPIVKKIAKKLPLDDDEEPRGLEHKTPRGCKLRQQNRFQAMDAVLFEQERQWERDRKDDNYIAQIYRQSSAHCQMNAYLIGQKDADAVAEDTAERQQLIEGNEETLAKTAREGEEQIVSLPATAKKPVSIFPTVDDKESKNNVSLHNQNQLLRSASSPQPPRYIAREVLSPQLLVAAL